MLSGLQPLDELRLENLIDESSLLNKDDFDGAISRVVEDDAMAPDAEPIIARKGGFQGANVAAFFTQAGERMFEGAPGFGREPAGILDDLG